MTTRQGEARVARTAALPPTTDDISAHLVRWWSIAALFPLGIGFLMYFVQNSDVEKYTLINPVAAVGEFSGAACQTYRKAGAFTSPHYMRVTYTFNAFGAQAYDAAGVPTPRSTQPIKTFTMTNDVSYRSWAECAAALPVTQALRAPRPLFYEASNPHSARSSLDRPDSTVYLWLGLLGIPLAIYAWLLGLLRARQTQTVRQAALGVVATGAGDRLQWPLRFVKFTQTPFARKAVVYLIFVLLLGGFIGQFFWGVEREQWGAERVRAAAGRAGQ